LDYQCVVIENWFAEEQTAMDADDWKALVGGYGCAAQMVCILAVGRDIAKLSWSMMDDG
jgi:hypothetical protein